MALVPSVFLTSYKFSASLWDGFRKTAALLEPVPGIKELAFQEL